MKHLILHQVCLIVFCLALFACRSPAARYDQVRPAEGKMNTAQASQLNREALDWIKKGDTQLAEKALRASLNADPFFGPAQNNLGKIYYDQHRYFDAAKQFESAARLMPESPQPRNNMGLTFEAAGRFDDAVHWYTLAHRLDPDDPQWLGNLVRARLRRGDEDSQLCDQLESLILKDPRRRWQSWARRTLLQLQSD